MRRSRARRRTSLRGLRPPALCLRRPLRRLQVGGACLLRRGTVPPQAGTRRRAQAPTGARSCRAKAMATAPAPATPTKSATTRRGSGARAPPVGTTRRAMRAVCAQEQAMCAPSKGRAREAKPSADAAKLAPMKTLGCSTEGALLARDDAERRSGGEREGQREAAVVDEGIERQKKRLACLHPSEQRAKRYRCQNVAQHACKYSAISAVEHQYYPFIRIIKILYRKYRDYIILYLVLFLIGVHLDRSLASPQGMARRRRVRC